MNIPLHITVLLVSALVLSSGVGDGYAQRNRALDPDKALTQYVHQVWRDDEGLPQNTVRTLLQTQDGYLWLGTEEGLVRFDGVRFAVFDKANTPAFAAGHAIESLYEDRAGVLWIGTSSAGLVRFADGHFTRFAGEEGLTGRAVSALYQDHSGHLWVGTRDAGLYAFRNGRFARYDARGGLSSEHVTALYQDRRGRLWVGTDAGLNRIGDDGVVVVAHTDRPGLFVTALYEDRAGVFWVGSRHGLHRMEQETLRPYAPSTDWTSGEVRALWEDARGGLWIGMRGTGLGRLHNGRLDVLTAHDGLSHEWVLALYGDREGSLWIGTEGGGLNRLWDGKFTIYTTREGLSSNMAMTVYEDRAGSLWVGTDGGGLNQLKDGVLTTYTTAQGLSSDIVSSVYQDRSGSLWVGTIGGGLNRLKDGVFTHYSTDDGLLSNAVYALYAGDDGGLWIGTDAGLARLRDGRFTAYTEDDGLDGDFIAALHEDRAGTLWIGTFDAGLVRFADGRFTRYTTDDGLGSNKVLALHEDADGALWIGTYEGGLSRLKDGVFTTFTTGEGLFDDNIYQILEDDGGLLWMSCNKGLFTVRKDTLDAFAEGAVDRIASTAYGKADGLRTSEMTGGIQPAGWKRRDGTLWFPSVEGVVSIDPQRLRRNLLPPPVLVEAVLVDNEPAALDAAAGLAPGKKKIEFQYAALSFVAPEAVRFRFFLDGYDDAWQEAGSNRTATYTNLPPGTYTFRVTARNSDGVWNEAGASISFTLRPFFYETTWFYLFCVLGASLLALLAYHGRTRQLRRRKRELEDLVETRTRDLRTAKEHIEAQAGKLKELDRFKTRFFANVSHEFRTPLTMIVGPLQAALQGQYGPLAEPVRRQLDIMLRNALRLLRLINQLLDLSKLEAGKMQLHARPRNIVDFLEGVVFSCTPFAEQKNIALRFRAADRGVITLFEPDKLEKVFFNLLSNAAKFTPEGGEITVTVSQKPAGEGFPQGAVEVRVRDTGIGIPEEALPYVFDRFRQADTSNTREHEGTGIGLALVKELVLLHRGTVDVTSEVGRGTEFVVCLPLGEAHLTPEEQVPADYQEGTFRPEQGGMAELAFSALQFMPEPGTGAIEGSLAARLLEVPQVLVVEDNDDVCEYVASILGPHYRVHTARDGLEGLEKAREIQPDLIISDLMMPKMDGNALCRAVKADPLLGRIPFVLLTARAAERTKIEGLEVGADDYLEKPFNARELLARAKNLIRLRQQEKELRNLNESLERKVEEQVQVILRERIAYEEKLLEAKEQAEHSLRLKSSILDNMNHEFRTPLTAIQGYAQILVHEVKGELKEFAALIDQGGARLMRTLDAVHQLSLLEAGSLDLGLEPVDLVEAVRAAEQRFAAAAGHKGLTVRVDVPPGEEKIEVSLNLPAVERILNYLLDNAIKFTDEGEVVLGLARQADYVSLCVRDTGIGIDPAFQPRLFDAFTQESTGLTRSHDGIGIGLTVARQLTERMGGAISVESAKGEGSVFTVRFPRKVHPARRAHARMPRGQRIN